MKAVGLVLASSLSAAIGDDIKPFDLDLIPLADENHVVSTLALDGPHIALFWRADCGPCLIELSHLADLQAAASDEVISISLDDPATARDALEKLGIVHHPAFAAKGDAASVLAAASGGPTRLPFSIALDSQGTVCGRHIGLLGTDMASSWRAACSK